MPAACALPNKALDSIKTQAQDGTVDSAFTVADVVRVLRALEGRAGGLTADAVRYYARTGMVPPSARLAGLRGARVYTQTDLALLRLVCRLRRQGLHERALWGLLVYRGDEVRAQLSEGTGEIRVDDAAQLAVGPRGASASSPVYVSVAALLHGLAEACGRYRVARPALWTGSQWRSAALVAHQVRG